MATPANESDQRWMRLALDQARHGLGLTSPNPPVGAVIVAEGQLIGQGHHRRAGLPHAEIEAINDSKSGAHADQLKGATLYVTLEPCCTHGRTPPCTDAILACGIKRVVWGAQDPNPQHQGRARDVLEAAGVEVTPGVLDQECQEIIRPFAKWVTTGMPYVIAKAGQSLDGRITRPFGEGQWLTSEAARAHGRRLRSRVDAIVVGAETIRRDNPMLTLRDPHLIAGEKEQPWRVILVRSGKLPEDAHVFTDAFKERTLVIRDQSLPDVLRDLGQRGVVTVLIEGGANVLGQAFRHQVVDEVVWYVAPILCGSGLTALSGPPLTASVTLDQVHILPIGDNVCISGRPVWSQLQPPQES